MGSPIRALCLPWLHLLLITFIGIFVSVTSAADYTNLVFKGCAEQKFQDPSGIYSQNLNNLLESLVSQSSQKSFSTTTSGDGQNAIIGLYQCRGDLTTAQCYTCVSKIPDMVRKLCGPVVAARVQLNGCFLRYEITGFKQVSDTELLFKVCGSSQATGSGFEGMRTAAFDSMVSGLKNGFYTGNYQTVFVLGQCEGDLSSDGCGNCVKSAVESVKNQCGDTVSGQVYLHKCYVSYSYYPNGVPTMNSPSGKEVLGTKQHTARTVAIVVGGIAAFGFLIVCLMFIGSLFKKHRRTKHDSWN